MDHSKPPVNPTPAPVSPPPAPGYHSPTGQPSGEDPGQTLAIVGIILAFFFSVAGLIVSIIANNKSKAAGFKNTAAVVGIWLNAVFTVLGLLAMIFWVVVIGVAISSGELDDSNPTSQQEAESTPADVKTEFKKGETAQFGNLEVKVNKVERNYTSTNRFSTPDEGKEFILVNVTIKNIGEEPESVSPFAFDINENGAAEGSAFVSDIPEKLESKTLSPGASVTGNVPYEVTKDATGLKLQYEAGAIVGEGSDTEYKRFTYTLEI